MAEKLEQIYLIVEEKAGMQGRMKLVVRTGIPKSVAREMIDDEAVVNKFKKTASDILGKDIEKFLENPD